VGGNGDGPWFSALLFIIYVIFKVIPRSDNRASIAQLVKVMSCRIAGSSLTGGGVFFWYGH